MSLHQIHAHTDLEGFAFPASLRVYQKRFGDTELIEKGKKRRSKGSEGEALFIISRTLRTTITSVN